MESVSPCSASGLEGDVLSEDQFRGLNEADLRRLVLMPLLERMGYKGVFEWHGGAGELGKDIVGWKQSDIGTRWNLAVVAKVTRLSSNNEIGDAVTQVSQALNTTFMDPQSGDDQHVHQVWVVTNK
jgi:hypothetical protein